MRFLALLALWLAAAEALAAGPDPMQRLGVAEARGGLWCLATGADGAAAGAALLLYEPYAGLRADARLAAAGEECGELKSRFHWPRQPDAPVRVFRIQPQDPAGIADLSGAGALFALLGAPAPVAGGGIDLDADGRPERFRICTSREGLNFVVESGEDVLWHAYYYLGLDVEPDCPERIYAE
ncbi:MAG TPA: hypothetical protein VNB28_00855 [Methylomirabilota bacterium]|jgi:hypothetical protein|nr:hypothetical protein [Methylomirabilota bacterium]